MGYSNSTRIENITIDNIPPAINMSTEVIPSNVSEWLGRANITDTYLRRADALILDNNNSVIIDWNNLCNNTQCDWFGSGSFNTSWHGETFSLNGTNVPLYYGTYFLNYSNESLALVPGCLSINGSDSNYSCGGTCSSPFCSTYRWWLVYNTTEQSLNEYPLLGLSNDNDCDINGCYVNSSMINSGTTKFMPQIDNFNFTDGSLSTANISLKMTVYNPGNQSNPKLLLNISSAGNYTFVFRAFDFWWTSLNHITDNITLGQSMPTVQLDSNMNWQNVSNVTYGFVGGIFNITGYANGTNFSNWTISLSNQTGMINSSLCFGNYSVDGTFCQWNTTKYCTGECTNYTINLTAMNADGVLNFTWLNGLVIDNLVPYINDTATLTTSIQSLGGSMSDKEFIVRTNITDNYLSSVQAYVLRNDTNGIVAGWGNLCNETSNSCQGSQSGMYNKSWRTDAYTLNGTPVSAYFKFSFGSDNNSYAEIPGCLDAAGNGNYDCGGSCPQNTNCNSYRWWLIYNTSNQSDSNSRLVGLTNELTCQSGPCIINTSIIQSGVSRFKVQTDFFNFTSLQTYQTNVTNLTLYNISNISNANLTTVHPSENFLFLYTAEDFAGNIAGSEWNFTVDNDLPIVNSVNALNPDIFFSPYDNVLNVSLNASDNVAISRAYVDVSSINQSACQNGTINLTYSNGLWRGNCTLNPAYFANITSPNVYTFNAYAYDSSLNWNYSVLSIILHNIGIPQYGWGCMRFGSDTTNFTNELNFSNINFVIDIEANLSCLWNGQIPISNFQDAALINLSSVNVSTQESAQKLMSMGMALQIQINAPKQFGENRIYINKTFFQELNTNATIKLFYLPFTSQPTILNDSDAAGFNESSIVWQSNVFSSQWNATTGNLTFNVYGFSGYNATDTMVPIINIISPTGPMPEINNTIGMDVNITVNGTGSEVSWVSISISDFNYLYNSTFNNASCNPVSQGSELYRCNFTANWNGLPNGLYNLTVTAYDFGNVSGNTIQNYTTLNISTEAPNVTIMSPVSTNYSISSILVNITNSSNAVYVWWNNGTADMPYTAPTNYSFGEGSHTIYAYANNSMGMTGSATVTFKVDLTPPVISIITPVNGMAYNNGSLLLNYTATDAITSVSSCWYSKDGAANNSTTCGNTVSLSFTPDGTHNITVFANDSVGNVGSNYSAFTVDTTPPTYSNNTTSPSSPATYAQGQLYIFNVTWNDNSGNLANAYLENNFSVTLNNATMLGSYPNYTYNSTPLAAGTYQFRFVGIDAVNNSNATSIQYFIINKANNSVNLYLNDSLNQNKTYTYPEVVNATATSLVLTPSLYKNEVSKGTNEQILLGNGTYAYKVNATGNQNYSDNSTGITYYAIVNKGTLSLSITNNQTVTYPNAITVTGTDINSGDADINYTLYLNTSGLVNSSSALGNGNISQTILLGVGSYLYIFNTSSEPFANWTVNSTVLISALTVNQNSTNPIDIYLNNSTVYKNQNITITYGTSVTANSTLVYQNSGTALLWKDGSNVTNPHSITLGAETYAYKGNTSGNLNYSANNSGSTYYVIVNKATPTCTLNSSNEWSYTYGANTTLICSCNGDGTTNMYFGGVLHNDYNNSSIIFSGNPSGHSIICNITSGDNYTSNSTSNSLVIQKNSSTNYMHILINDTESDLTYTYENTTNVTSYSTIAGQTELTFNLYRNGASMGSSSSAPFSVSDVSQLGASTYTYVYNTTGNANYSSANVTRTLNISKKTPTLNLSTAGTVNYGTGSNVSGSMANTFLQSDFTLNLYVNGTGPVSTNSTYPYLVSDNTTYGGGTYTFALNNSASANYSSASTSAGLIVNTIAPSIKLIISPSNSTTYGTSTTATGTVTTGDAGASTVLYRNASSVGTSTETNTLGAGTYNYTFYYVGSQNYSALATTNITTIAQATPTLVKLLNGAANNTTIAYPQPVNATGTVTSGAGTLTIYRDGANITQSGTNYTYEVAYHSFNFSVASNQNYTAVW
jgi:hypothetical protein